ncbi:MAG TPA: hypothetical protein VM121_11225, partial [Acidimicrobiales bacterium]|nr:hypothetical protein [Acidimicrobiales bacterium]
MTQRPSLRRPFTLAAMAAFSAMLAGLLIGAGQLPSAAVDDGLVPVLLKDVAPGTASSSPSKFTQLGSKVLFQAT